MLGMLLVTIIRGQCKAGLCFRSIIVGEKQHEQGGLVAVSSSMESLCDFLLLLCAAASLDGVFEFL